MSQSLTQIYLHIVFSTKNREPFLHDKPFRARVHAYLAGICKGLDSPCLQVGGVADHVHVLSRLAKTIAVADLIRELKRDSTKWIKLEAPDLGEFHWQGGYGAFSISPGHVDGLIDYIKNQEEHHKHETFQEEFRKLCEKYGVGLDERYALD